MEPDRDDPQDDAPARERDDASAVGWHGRSDDYDLPVTPWRPVHTVEVRGDRL